MKPAQWDDRQSGLGIVIPEEHYELSHFSAMKDFIFINNTYNI